jgi:hypothetical protein
VIDPASLRIRNSRLKAGSVEAIGRTFSGRLNRRAGSCTYDIELHVVELVDAQELDPS